MNKILIIILILFINSCGHYGLIKEGSEINVNNLYSVKAPIEMSELRVYGSNLKWFTNNGRGLDLFFFSDDIYPEDTLSDIDKKKDAKKYKKKMNNIEFVDFVGEAFSDFGFTNFKLYDVGEINSSVGIFQRFYLRGTDKKIGLKYKAIIDRHFERDILRINGFIAPEKHYYDTYIQMYETMIRSLIKK